MNRYRAIHPSFVALYGDDVFDYEFGSPDEERDAIAQGRLELVPRPYRVLSDNYTVDGAPVEAGTVIDLALPIEIEAWTVAGGHLERVDKPASPKKAAAKRAAQTKE